MQDELFDRIVVISLKRTPDRLRQFWDRLDSAGWPFKTPEVFEAVDGSKVPVPSWFRSGGPAWGCLQSHRQVIEQALRDGVKRLLILEDDAAFTTDAGDRIKKLMASVPANWDCLMIGGQMMSNGKSKRIAEGVYRVQQCERTHCYALSAKGMKSLYKWWSEPVSGHCDWRLGEWQEKPDVFAYRPDPIIAAQASNFSTIRFRNESTRTWDRRTKLEYDGPNLELDATSDRIKAAIAGKTVAIVGNAPTIKDYADRTLIESADIVIRFNRFTIGAEYPAAGVKTDIIAYPIGYEPGTPTREMIDMHNPKMLAGWYEHGYRRILEEAKALGVSAIPAEFMRSLQRAVGCRPTTGLIFLAYVLDQCQPASVYVTGFSLKKTQSDHYYPGQKFDYITHDPIKELHYIAMRWSDWSGRLTADPWMIERLTESQPANESANDGAFSKPHQWVYDRISELIAPGSVIEVGGGIGHFLPILAKSATKLAVVEPDSRCDADLVPAAARSGATIYRSLKDVGERFDIAVCAEVLEHLPAIEVHNFLKMIREKAGRLFLSSPDRRKHGHGRRTMLELGLALRHAGWTVERKESFDWENLMVCT